MLKAGAKALLYFFIAVSIQGCYSFSGASLPPHIKTIAIPVFEDHSGAGIAQFRSELTQIGRAHV